MIADRFVYLFSRLSSVYRSRGIYGFIKFLSTRIIRLQKDNLYQKDATTGCVSEFSSIPESIIKIDRHVMDEDLESKYLHQFLSCESEEYEEGLRNNDVLYVIADKDVVIHFSFAQFFTKYKTLLGLPESIPLIGNCYTSPAARGKRLYPKTLVYATQDLFKKGCDKVAITCAPSNVPSIKGIERAGFQLTSQLYSIIFLSRLVLQVVKYDKTSNKFRFISYRTV